MNKVLVIYQGTSSVYSVSEELSAQQIANSLNVTDSNFYQEFPESDFEAACYSFPQAFFLAEGVVSFNLTSAKGQAVDIVKAQAATEEATLTAGYSANRLASQSSLAAIDRLPEIQAVLDGVNNLATTLSNNIAAIESASDIETVYNIVQQPSGTINTGRGGDGQAGPLDLNLSYFTALNDMPGYTQADLELYVPGTDTVIPYNAGLPDPYTFDSAGNCFNTGDYRLVVRYAGGGAVITTITVPQGNNTNVNWTYNPNIPGLGGSSHHAA